MTSEKRKEKRSIVTHPVDCSSELDSGPLSAKGITLNVSPSGVSFYTHSSLEEGLKLKVSGDQIWDKPREGEVRWCRKIIGGLYRVGIMFSPPA